MSARAGAWLLAASVVCEAISVASGRFIFEICHHGVSLLIPVIGLPVAGALFGIGSLFSPSPSRLVAATKVIVVVANVYQLAAGISVLLGPGLVSCG